MSACPRLGVAEPGLRSERLLPSFIANSVICAFVTLGVAACGDGQGEQATVVVSTGSLSFSAASPDAAAPAPQSFSASISTAAVYVAINHHGPAIAATHYTVSGGVAQVEVTPSAPSTVGAGTFSGTVVVTGYACGDAACSALVAGNTETVAVTLAIPPIVRHVAPYVGTSNTAGRVLVRGQGFKSIDIQGVLLGTTPATTYSVAGDTQIQVDYPALAAGTYPVSLQSTNSPGPILTTANLVVVGAPAFGAGVLNYPSASPAVKSLTYDAERSALWVGTDISGGTLLRFPYTAGWGAPAVLAVSGLADAALSVGGETVLALAGNGLSPVDAQTLVVGSSVPAPALPTGAFLKNLVVTNDGKSVVTTGIPGTTNTSLYVFDAKTSGFSVPATTPSLINATPGVSMDGSLVSIAQGDMSLATAPAVYQYFAATGLFGSSTATIVQNGVAPVLNRTGTRIILNGTQVYDAAYTLLGTLPATTAAVVIVDRSSSPTTLYDSSIAYTFDSGTTQLRIFDITSTANGLAFAETGSGVALPGDPGTGVRMSSSPDGGNLFLAGANAVIVVPTPP